MRRLLPSRLNSLSSPSQRRRAWLALWAQDRRRGRVAGTGALTLLDGLEGYWAFDEASTGNRADSHSIYTLYEIEYPEDLVPGSCGWTTGKLGNGTNLSLGNWNFGFSPLAPVLDVSANFSVSFWYKRSEDVGGGSHCVSIEPSFLIACGTGDWGFTVDLYGPDFATNGRIYSETLIPYDTWVHCVAVREGSTLKLYQDGVLVGTDAIELSVAEVIGNLHIGPSWWGYIWGYECFDEVGVWQRALSAGEVSELYNGGDGLAYEFF